MPKYEVTIESWDVYQIVVEADNEQAAEDKALDNDDGRIFVSGECEITDVRLLHEESNDSGSGERTEDEGDVS